MTGAVFEWPTSNTFIDYPFDARQDDGLHELFVDAYLIHNKERTREARVRVASFDPTGDAELRFEDGTLLVTLTSADNFSSSVFGSYTVYEWRRSSTIGVGFTDEDIIFRLTAHTEKLSHFSFPHPSTTAYLLSSLVNPRISRVRRIATALPGVPCCTGGGITDKPVILEAGNNMQLSVVDGDAAAGFTLDTGQTVRAPTNIVFDAAGGLGTGTFKTCGSLLAAIRRIGGVGVDDLGDFSLEGDECTWGEKRLSPGPTQPPIHPNTDYLAVALDNLLQIHANCEACCDCADYGTVYQELKDTWTRLKELAARAEAARIRYNELVENWLDIRDAKHNGLNVSIRAMANPDFNLGLMWLLWNNEGEDMTDPITIEVDLQTTGSVYVEKTGHLDMEGYRFSQIDPIRSGTKYTLTVPPLRTAQYATYNFSVRFGAAGPSRVDKVVRPKATATAGATSVEDEASVALVGPLRKA